MKVRLIEEIGTRVSLRIYWGGGYWDAANGAYVNQSECPNCKGQGNTGYHNARIPILDCSELGARDIGGLPEKYPDAMWPTHCDHCGTPVPVVGTAGLNRQVFHSRLYNTSSGKPEPGDIYWVSRHQPGECPFWDNCDGPHLFVILPNGSEWEIDSRAPNCTMPHDRTHRCWVRHGDPPNIHVDKNGHTCQAGAGSIAVPGWHGFLHHGELRGC